MSVQIVVPQSTDLDELQLELCMESLTDLKLSVEAVLKDCFPSIPFEVSLDYSPYPKLSVGIPKLADDPKYPSFIRLFKRDIASLKLTDYGREKLGVIRGK